MTSPRRLAVAFAFLLLASFAPSLRAADNSAVQERAEAVLGRGTYVARVNTHDVYFQPGMYEIVAGSPQALKAIKIGRAHV